MPFVRSIRHFYWHSNSNEGDGQWINLLRLLNKYSEHLMKINPHTQNATHNFIKYIMATKIRSEIMNCHFIFSSYDLVEVCEYLSRRNLTCKIHTIWYASIHSQRIRSRRPFDDAAEVQMTKTTQCDAWAIPNTQHSHTRDTHTQANTKLQSKRSAHVAFITTDDTFNGSFDVCRFVRVSPSIITYYLHARCTHTHMRACPWTSLKRNCNVVLPAQRQRQTS